MYHATTIYSTNQSRVFIRISEPLAAQRNPYIIVLQLYAPRNDIVTRDVEAVDFYAASTTSAPSSIL